MDPTPRADLAPQDEASLLARLRAGEDQAYKELVRIHTGHLMAVADRILENEADAADAVQDAFLALFKSLEGFRGHCRVSTWLHRVVTNAALMRLRSRLRKPECSLEDLLPMYYQNGHRIDPRPAWREGPGEVLLREESRRMVREKISQLPEDSRNVLLLRDIQQISTAEAAEQLDVSEAVVKTRLHRARQALRKLLEEELLHA